MAYYIDYYRIKMLIKRNGGLAKMCRDTGLTESTVRKNFEKENIGIETLFAILDWAKADIDTIVLDRDVKTGVAEDMPVYQRLDKMKNTLYKTLSDIERIEEGIKNENKKPNPNRSS